MGVVLHIGGGVREHGLSLMVSDDDHVGHLNHSLHARQWVGPVSDGVSQHREPVTPPVRQVYEHSLQSFQVCVDVSQQCDTCDHDPLI